MVLYVLTVYGEISNGHQLAEHTDLTNQDIKKATKEQNNHAEEVPEVVEPWNGGSLFFLIEQ